MLYKNENADMVSAGMWMQHLLQSNKKECHLICELNLIWCDCYIMAYKDWKDECSVCYANAVYF